MNNTKNKYIKELERKLRKMPASEKNEAILYYKEYLVDSGIDTYEEAVYQVGSPTKVAAKVMAEHYLKDAERPVVQPERNRWKVVMAVIAAIFAIPIALPLAIGLLLVILVILFCIFLIIALFFLVSVLFFITALASIIMSIPTFVVHFYTAIFMIGSGLAALGVGIYMFQFSQFLARKSYQGLLALVRSLQRRGEQHA